MIKLQKENDELKKLVNQLKERIIELEGKRKKNCKPYHISFEDRMRSQIKKIYPDKKVIKEKFKDNGNVYEVDILIVDEMVLDAKSGRITEKELDKIILYSKLAGVSKKGIILSNMSYLTGPQIGICKKKKISILYSDKLNEGLEELEKNDFVKQDPPPNHIKNSNDNILNTIDMKHYISLDQPDWIDNKPAQLSLWAYRKEITNHYIKGLQNKDSKTKIYEDINKEYEISSGTVRNFIVNLIRDMKERGVSK